MIQLAERSLLGVLVAFALSAAAVWVLRPLARKLGWLDHPGGRKAHNQATPNVGGLGVAAGVLVGSLLLQIPLTPGIVAGVALIVAAGRLDDRFDLAWPVRLVMQAGAVLAMVLLDGLALDRIGAVFGAPQALQWLGAPVAVLLAMGFINAMNMVDGLDGLAGTAAAAGLLVLGFAAAVFEQPQLLLAIGLCFGAVAGFLAFNIRWPGRAAASVFLGNNGSELLGLLLAWLGLRLAASTDGAVDPTLLGFVIAPALLDCLVLMVRRPLCGRSPFQADRTHLHHLMLDAGWSVNAIVALIGATTLGLGLFATAMLTAGLASLVVVLLFLLLAGALFVVTADEQVRARLTRLAPKRGRAAPPRVTLPVDGR
jgi:UDP-GlcNAc:undecaprenyl-phosphate/decaprenyl-phosphate GlcNAc-1-phosphate transferase